MEQKDGADQRDHDEFLHQLEAQVVDRTIDQQRAVVGRLDLDTRRQARLQCGQLVLDGLDGGARVLAGAHDHHAPGHFAFAIQFRDAAAHFRSDLDRRDVAQQHRCGTRQRQRNGPEIFQRLQEAARANHVLGLGQFDHRATAGLVGIAQGVDDRGLRDAERAHAVGIEHHLVLPNHAADAGDLGHIRYRFQLELEKPVVQRAKLAEVSLAGAVDQRVLVDPAHARGIRPQRSIRACRQFALHLVEVFDDAGTCPIRIGLVVEQDIDKRVPEERVAAHRLCAGHAEHGRGQRVSDQVFDHLRRLARVRGANDHLGVRQIGQCIERRVHDRPQTGSDQKERCDQHQEAVADRPANQRCDHGLAAGCKRSTD